MNHSFSKILTTKEYLELPRVERAVKLINEQKASAREAAKAVVIDRSQLNRALKAIRDGRDVGVNGRPNHLKSNEQIQVINIVRDEIQNGQRPKHSDICNTVKLLFSSISAIILESLG